MHPILEFEFDKIDTVLSNEYFKVHNQVYNDLNVLFKKVKDLDSKKYIKVFLSKFKELNANTDQVSETIICCSRNKVVSILQNTNENTLNKIFFVSEIQDSNFSNEITNNLQKDKKNNPKAEISLKTILLDIFNYEGNRSIILQYYASKNYSVCAYCLAQYTSIYKSNTRGKYYLTGNLDHVSAKDKNPLLSISINNLIPVCGPCNQRKSNLSFTYDPFNQDHIHNFDFTDCLTINEHGEVIFGSLEDLKILSKKTESEDLSKKLDYKDLYSNFSPNAKILIERYKKFHSDGYKEHFEAIIKDSNTSNFVDYFVSEIPLIEQNILKHPLTKFKIDLFERLKNFNKE